MQKLNHARTKDTNSLCIVTSQALQPTDWCAKDHHYYRSASLILFPRLPSSFTLTFLIIFSIIIIIFHSIIPAVQYYFPFPLFSAPPSQSAAFSNPLQDKGFLWITPSTDLIYVHLFTLQLPNLLISLLHLTLPFSHSSYWQAKYLTSSTLFGNFFFLQTGSLSLSLLTFTLWKFRKDVFQDGGTLRSRPSLCMHDW